MAKSLAVVAAGCVLLVWNILLQNRVASLEQNVQALNEKHWKQQEQVQKLMGGMQDAWRVIDTNNDNLSRQVAFEYQETALSVEALKKRVEKLEENFGAIPKKIKLDE